MPHLAVMAGYSGTLLPQKLGIKPGAKVATVADPGCLTALLEPLPAGVALMPIEELSGKADVIVLFAEWRANLEAALPTAIDRLATAGGLWIAWPKKASKVPTDITEDTLRSVILPIGLVDNKVCAIDDTWSGLRFVWRKELRGVGASRNP